METLLKADIFFFVTTIAVVVVAVFLVVMLWYFIRTIRRLKELADEIELKLDTAGEDLKDIRERITDSFLFNLLFPKRHKKKKHE